MERGRERRGELGCCWKGVFGEVSGEGGVERGVDGERSVLYVVILYCLCVVGEENVYYV